MIRSLLLALPLLTLAPTAPTARSAPPGDELRPGEVVEGELGQKLDAYLTRLEGLGFSGVAGVDFGGEPILIRGYGMANRAEGRPVTPETVFTTGSITKQFTGAAIMKLFDLGKLSLEDSLTKFFDDVPADKRGITVHHLLSQGSGLSDPPAGDFDTRATADWVRAQAFETPLLWEPGHAFRYMNVNFSLAAMIVERVSGQSYEAFMREHLFLPAGMESTGYLLPQFPAERLAHGYDNGQDWGTLLERPMLEDGPAWTLRGNGGVHSTVGDMLRWHHALEENVVLSEKARALYETPYIPEGGGTHYAYGWSIDRSPSGGKLVAHNGGNMIFFADFLRFVDDGFTIYVATNVATSVSQDLAYELAAIVFEEEPPAVPETIARDRAMLDAYAGRYPLGDGSTLVLSNGGDRLVLTGEGEDARLLLVGAEVLDLEERTQELVGSVVEGDYRPLLDSYAGRQSAESIRAELDEGRARTESTLGAFRELGGCTSLPGRGGLRIAVEARYENGSAWLWMGWRRGRVVEFVLEEELPFEGMPTIELFPFAQDEFHAWNGRSGFGMGLEFVLEGGEVVALRLGDPPLEIARE